MQILNSVASKVFVVSTMKGFELGLILFVTCLKLSSGKVNNVQAIKSQVSRRPRIFGPERVEFDYKLNGA